MSGFPFLQTKRRAHRSLLKLASTGAWLETGLKAELEDPSLAKQAWLGYLTIGAKPYWERAPRS